MLVGDDGFVPKERYVSQAFLDLEMERLWPRVWQVACREEQVAEPGQFVEYTIGDQSVLVVRTEDGRIRAHHNACLHRGTRLASGCGRFDTGSIRCRYHAWRYGFDGRLIEVVDADEFDPMPEGSSLGAVRAECWGGFVFVNFDPDAEPLLDYLQPLPELLAAYHLERMRFPRVPDDDPSGELEGGRRRVQRGVPRAGHAPAVAAVDRRRLDRVRATRHPRALRPSAGSAPRAASEPAARPGTRRVRRGRDPRRTRRWSRSAVLEGRAGDRRGAPFVAAPIRRRRCSTSSRTGAATCSPRVVSTCRRCRSIR